MNYNVGPTRAGNYEAPNIGSLFFSYQGLHSTLMGVELWREVLKTFFGDRMTAQKERRNPVGGVNIITPDPRKYHAGVHGTMIPVSCEDGSSSGFDSNKPGKVTVVGYGTFDPITGKESVAPSVTVDYSKLTAEQLEDVAAGITFAGVGSVHKPPRDDIANAFESLAKQQAIQVSFLRRCLQAVYKFLFTA